MTDVISITELSMLNDMRLMKMVSHNLSNANTVGYKRDMPHSSLFSAQLDAVRQASIDAGDLVPEVKALLDASQGMMKLTKNPLNIAIEGDGFFELSGPAGTLYRRSGEFSLNSKGILVSPEGYAVNGMNGDIRLLSDNPRIDGQGKIWEGEDLVGQLKVVQFDQQADIQKMGNGLFGISGMGKTVEDTAQVRQGFIETANVNVTDEMVRMMTTVRHFEMSQRLITNYDDMINKAISSIAEF